MPAPTDTLLVAAAEAIYTNMRTFWDETSALGGPRKSRTSLLTWDQLDEEHHLRWIEAAKEAYCVFAVAGGAKRVDCGRIEPGSPKDD